jgi:hypothetical protein
VTTNVLIGVGGTGAKVVEATLHLAAAGLGPQALRVGFVDQDQSNGNVSRAISLLKLLAETRAQWRSMGAHHRVGAAADGPGSDLLATDIGPIVANDELWVPHQGQNMTLSRILGDMGDDRQLYDVLFSKGVAEQDMVLDEGYRGRPHIGSAALTARVDQEADFWKALIQYIRQAQGGREVRLLLAGSVFGGTGAAGFPTLSRLIRRKLKQENITANVAVAGVLMLPYFAFNPPEADSVAAANVARSEELLIQSRGALKYYSALFAQEHVFDELYLVGWNRPFDLGYHSAGAGGQENPALAPEFIAALGACRFFSADHDVEIGNVDNDVFVSAREKDNALGWADLPSPTKDEQDAPYHKLGRMLRFSVAWKHWAPILMEPRSMFSRALNRHPWFRAQGVDKVDYVNRPPGEAINALMRYVDALLAWTGSIQAYATNNAMTFSLWRLNDVISGRPQFDTPLNLLKIKSSLTEPEFATAFNQIVIKRSASDDLPNASLMATRLSEQPAKGSHSGLGQMVAALHAYSGVTVPADVTAAV